MRLRTSVAIALAIAAGTAAVRADDAVPARFDCFLPDGPVECRALGGAYFEAARGVRAQGANAELTVRVRATAVRDGMRIFADFEGSAREAPRFTLQDTVPARLDRDAALVRIVALLERGTAPFATPRGGPGAGGDDADPTRWYFSPSLNAELFEAGASSTSLGGGAEVSWSHPDWRLRVSGKTWYRRLHLAIPGNDAIDGEFLGGAGDAVLARTIDGGFGIALLGTAVRATEDNLDARLGAGIGVEWVLRPFLRADENGFGFRYRVRLEHHDYVTPNVLGSARAWLPVHAPSAFVRWHTERFDLGLEIGATQTLTHTRFWELRGGVEAAWRLVGDVQLELTAGLAWRGDSPNEPADPAGLDPAASLIGGNDFGTIAWEGGLELSYAFGSSLLRAQDQRWR